MNISLDINTLGVIASWIGIAWVWFGDVKKNTSDMAVLKLQVSTMWDFQMHRAEVEAVSRGVARKKSPIEVTNEAKAWVAPLLPLMRDFYERLGHRMTERDLEMEIIRRFDDKIIEEICIPQGVSAGACLIIVKQALKEAFGK